MATAAKRPIRARRGEATGPLKARPTTPGPPQAQPSNPAVEAPPVVAAPTNDERRDRWRRDAGTVRWQDETGDRSGAPAPSPS